MSNLNYRKRSATRYDDLVFWYAFDEAQGSTATDYSANGQDATLKNMTAANRMVVKLAGVYPLIPQAPRHQMIQTASISILVLGHSVVLTPLLPG